MSYGFNEVEMDHINKIFIENRDVLSGNLSAAGFSTDQIDRFLPVVSSSISSVFHQSGMEKNYVWYFFR